MDHEQAVKLVEEDPEAHGSAGLLRRITDLEERLSALEGKKQAKKPAAPKPAKRK